VIIYVDIDETICEHPTSDGPRDYSKAKPITKRIDKINALFEEGNTIVYWTARGTTTGIDWTELTAGQLQSWGAKHHDLMLGKPHYDLFIDDKNINSETFFKET
tara:strand:+ start:1287 stop:1598 length:312 start_codon:yes stop_codon:yes gene_type:complete